MDNSSTVNLNIPNAQAETGGLSMLLGASDNMMEGNEFNNASHNMSNIVVIINGANAEGTRSRTLMQPLQYVSLTYIVELMSRNPKIKSQDQSLTLSSRPSVDGPKSGLVDTAGESATPITRMPQPTTTVWKPAQAYRGLTGRFSHNTPLLEVPPAPRARMGVLDPQLMPPNEVAHPDDRAYQSEADGWAAQSTTGGPGYRLHSPRFQRDWAARTEARKKIYCSLNRAGNALCAWHDERRERRMYPSHAAPRGLLNCGCSYEEGLFDECLSRHALGSYHPGEAVRMDPALRNPLLKLLECRYGYKDGDFDLDPMTGAWKEGQSPEDWQTKAQRGSRYNKNKDKY